MGDILSKLQMVSEKIGVTETAHTIEEQVDLISESLDKIPHSTNIAEALDDLSEVAQNINNEEVYVDKTITENGEYLPAEDEATAYSKVTVNVLVNFEYVTFSDISQTHGLGLLCKKDDGVYVLPSGRDIFQDQENAGHYNSYLLTPAITICPLSVETGKIVFTPGENFDFVNRSGESLSGITGDTITPNDGKVYYLTIYVDLSEGYRLVREVTKTNIDFYSSVIR